MAFFKKYRNWIIGLLLVYLAGGFALYFLQHKFLFHPEAIPEEQAYRFSIPFQELEIRYNETDRIALAKFPVRGSIKKGTVVFYHGNRDNMERYEPYADFLTESGYEVWMLDYPTFGKSTGKITEETLYRDALTFYDRVAATDSTGLVVYGKSLGTAMASYVAAKRNCRQLILETPYYSIDRLARRFVPFYPVHSLLRFHMSNSANLEKVSVPVLLLHGSSDGVIPYEHSLLLQREAELAQKSLQLTGIDGGSHNDLLNYPKFKSAVLRFCQKTG